MLVIIEAPYSTVVVGEALKPGPLWSPALVRIFRESYHVGVHLRYLIP